MDQDSSGEWSHATQERRERVNFAGRAYQEFRVLMKTHESKRSQDCFIPAKKNLRIRVNRLTDYCKILPPRWGHYLQIMWERRWNLRKYPGVISDTVSIVKWQSWVVRDDQEGRAIFYLIFVFLGLAHVFFMLLGSCESPCMNIFQDPVGTHEPAMTRGFLI